MYAVCSSYAEQSKCVGEVAAAAEQICREFAYSHHDARWIALNNIATTAKANQLVLNLLDSWSRGDERVRAAIPHLLGIATVTPEAVKSAGDWLGSNSRLGFVLIAQFQIENLVKNLSRELNLKLPQPYYTAVRNLLERLGLSHGLETLNVPALIRNSLHSNGIHHGYRGESKTVVVHGVTYEFVHGHRVRCASWEHVAHALEGSLGVLGQVLDHHDVRSIADPMMDAYAWDVATEPASA